MDRHSGEPPTAWNLCLDRHFFHAIGRKKERKRKGKKRKGKEKEGRKKREEKKKTLVQVNKKSIPTKTTYQTDCSSDHGERRYEFVVRMFE